MKPSSTAVAARVVADPSGDDGNGLRFRVMVSPGIGGEQVDVTRPLVAAIAHALWHTRGGDDLTNWADAEGALDQLLGQKEPAGALPPATGRTTSAGQSATGRFSEVVVPQPQRRTQPVRR